MYHNVYEVEMVARERQRTLERQLRRTVLTAGAEPRPSHGRLAAWISRYIVRRQRRQPTPATAARPA